MGTIYEMPRLNKNEQSMVEQLEAMTIEEARKALSEKQFGDIGSPGYLFCSSWLTAKEASLRDAREAESLSLSRKALIIAIIAMILSASAIIIQVIKWSSG